MLHVGGTGFVSTSSEGLDRMVTNIVEVIASFGFPVSKRKTEMMLMPV